MKKNAYHHPRKPGRRRALENAVAVVAAKRGSFVGCAGVMTTYWGAGGNKNQQNNEND